jgi:hypothetical protein
LQKPRRPAAARGEPYVWRLPGEAPGTLAEIFAAEDSRAQSLVLYELREVDGFRRCWEAIGASGNSHELIGAVMVCINQHLTPLNRPADHRRRMRVAANRAHAAAVALYELSSSMNEVERIAWLWRLESQRLPDPTDPRIIAEIRNLAARLGYVVARGHKDQGGPSKKMAFERLISRLADVFESATERRATLTYDPSENPPRYRGKFWEFVEIVRPVAAGIIAKSGEPPLTQSVTELARGKFIARALVARRRRSGSMDKTPAD